MIQDVFPFRGVVKGRASKSNHCAMILLAMASKTKTSQDICHLILSTCVHATLHNKGDFAIIKLRMWRWKIRVHYPGGPILCHRNPQRKPEGRRVRMRKGDWVPGAGQGGHGAMREVGYSSKAGRHRRHIMSSAPKMRAVLTTHSGILTYRVVRYLVWDVISH